jgi:SAM-dependent methyltransferase
LKQSDAETPVTLEEIIHQVVEDWLKRAGQGDRNALRDAVNDKLKAELDKIPREDCAGRFRCVEEMEAAIGRETSPIRGQIKSALRHFQKITDHLCDDALARFLDGPEGRIKSMIRKVEDRDLQKALKSASLRALHLQVLSALKSGAVRWDGFLAKEARFGRGMSERVIELPLALEMARLSEPGKVLDAGCSLNHPDLLGAVGPLRARLVHLTISGEREPMAIDSDNVSYVFGDLRSMDWKDGTFDRIACVSTIEHVGLDNTMYGGPRDNDPGSWILAFRELRRVLRPGGRLLLTFPHGPAENRGWFQVLDDRDVNRMLEESSGDQHHLKRFRYDGGWFEEPEGTRPGEPIPAVLDDVVTRLAVLRITKAGGPSTP